MARPSLRQLFSTWTVSAWLVLMLAHERLHLL
jgi:hypothetical protein